MLNRMFRYAILVFAIFVTGCATQGGGAGTAGTTGTASDEGKGITITKPRTTATVQSPVEICMEANGYTIEPAKNGVNEGKGHLHLIVDAPLPDLTQPIPKDSNHIHMGDGSKCKVLELSKGWHTITALLAYGNHVPYNPAVKDSIIIEVR